MADGRVEKGAATRHRLLAAARERFGSDGYDGTSITAILDDAGASRGSLYHHFETKEALFTAVLDDVIVELTVAAAEAASAEPDPLSSLQAGFAVWLEQALVPSVRRLVIVDAPAVLGWSRWREMEGRHVLRGVRSTMHQLADDGWEPPGDLDLLSNMLLAAVSEAALMIASADAPELALVKAQTTVAAVLERLLTNPPRR